ncbi:glycosyltransferase family 2 protein [Dichomitus squalens LYAD-421 SS1]|uniref:chitin synthase n=1 Tax=Dichomitus squalens (strain LYAD-421) TaxID=732165 RepID=R7SS04_DICSQ|nr:glycosyltransferase family 2 protein [Dichomitus squalens LYAD-421 SS1]EJF57737.1 glycosyltransferase family 2 protein [Dichomitus squalens LYAD-421 SS1]
MSAQFRPKFDPSDVPIPTSRTLQPSATTVRRAKTLTRPERTVAPVPLINAQVAHSAAGPRAAASDDGPPLDAWRIFSRVVSFWAPDFLLESLGGLRDKQKRQAWREKIALCFIIIILCGGVGFVTVGFQKVLCPDTTQFVSRFAPKGSVGGVLGVQGWQMNITKFPTAQGVNFTDLLKSPGQDITTLFQRNASQYPACSGLSFRAAAEAPCPQADKCPIGQLDTTSLEKDGFINTTLVVGYDWDQVAALQNYLVIDGAVLNMNSYMALHPTPIPSDNVDAAIRTVLQNMPGGSGRDATRLFYYRSELRQAVPCLVQRYYAGNIDKITPGCVVSQLVLYAGLIVVLSLVMVRFAMACVFNWFMSSRLAGPPDNLTLNRSAISPAVMPEGANVSIDNLNGTAPWAGPGGTKRLMKPNSKTVRSMVSSSSTLVNNRDSGAAAPVMSLAQIGAELFAVCLVTCYSEGEDSLRTTLDSISTTSYADQRKLLFVVADGMITGAGEKRSTPDICVSLLEADPRFGNPVPMSYAAVGSGAKSENRAMVYAGHYTVAGRRTPTVVVVKCGTEQEAATDKKPGNRGKRDSQLILMNFFSRVTYNDRMSPLDFDLFRKIHVLMGVTPDFFEVCLMVDADTKVYPDSLKYLVNCMHHDQMIMGVCGETRIANKRQSWVTAIQVFEYFISHHNAKAFESVFGGVSCLPGCFSMFRLKARKATGDDWVPLIIKPEIVKEYSQSVVTTLHEKNLLLLGEDRFLTTILLRTFPNRKMMFLPQAKCRTVVPDTFSVLLSQRRRWINSTIHNLMELVLVRNLCGTFCFSMQFVVFMDLLGTVVLPIAISLTYMLIVGMILAPPHNFEEAIPLVLLIAVLGLPAILILITTRKVVYIFWMLIYLAALPVWNFVLPVYAFWHFDDFSWGETRKVEGERKGEAHGEGAGVIGAASVPMRRWEDWERSRLRKIRREERRRREFERQHGAYIGSNGELVARSEVYSQYDGSDTVSVASSDDDHWGAQIGGYNENSVQYPPPPVTLMPQALASAETIAGSDLEAMLEVGFDERSSGRARGHETRFQLSDRGNGYTPLSRATSPGVQTAQAAPLLQPISPTTPGDSIGTGSSADWQAHGKESSGGRSGKQDYGPLGPLDPRSKF